MAESHITICLKIGTLYMLIFQQKIQYKANILHNRMLLIPLTREKDILNTIYFYTFGIIEMLVNCSTKEVRHLDMEEQGNQKSLLPYYRGLLHIICLLLTDGLQTHQSQTDRLSELYTLPKDTLNHLILICSHVNIGKMIRITYQINTESMQL